MSSFANLAPHRGLVPVYGYAVGNSEMRGGYSFSNFVNGLNKFGHLVSNAATRIGNSQLFQQAKTGLLQSGALESAGHLAGSALGALTDIAKLKIETDLQKLRDKVTGQSGSQADQLALLLAALQQQQQQSQVPGPGTNVVLNPQQQIQQPAVMPAPPVPAEHTPVPLGPYFPPDAPPPSSSSQVPPALVEPPVVPSTSSSSAQVSTAPPRRPMRKRRRVSGWGAALDGLTRGKGMGGYGADFYQRRYCFD
ncbi:pVI protein [Barthadenovirus mellis]|uniref:PVI protein n=1 Tax=Passerine adenovirus 1 TaxID=2779174 RepID=A0A7L9DK55_9ADEN|nr:pVI protein [Passerine adenovirus 1]